ncbi:potassium channel family protein [Ruegeria jejuensis]|uniref:potassium channel family protein n=1 Tax=Ruegeria jejuensis TaxID=3233338 RepID=UPI00355C3C3C
MSEQITLANEFRRTLLGAAAMVFVSSAAFYFLSHLDEKQAGNAFGNVATIGLAIWLLVQIWLHAVLVESPRRQLIIMGISFIQVVPFLFAAVYGAFGYNDLCVIGAEKPSDMLYFSYVTFTTVGYGDLQPVGLCRTVAVAEAVTGYVLLGLFVAATIASYTRTHQRNGRT